MASQQKNLNCDSLQYEDFRTRLNRFEKYCTVKNYGKLIQTLIENNKENQDFVNKVNKHIKKAPIHLVAEIANYNNLKALLTAEDVDVNIMANKMTPLLKLALDVTDENVEEVFKCIELLLERGANPNIPNQMHVTPIIAVLQLLEEEKIQKSTAEKLVDLFLEKSVDLDIYLNGEARKLLTKLFPEKELPNTSCDNQTKYEELRHSLICISDESEKIEDDLLKHLRTIERDFVVAEEKMRQDNLTLAAAENGQCKVLKELIDMDDAVETDGNRLFRTALLRGHWRVLEIILECKKIKIDLSENFLCPLVQKIGNKLLANYDNYMTCLHMLLCDRRFDVNQTDSTKRTAMHYAVKNRNPEVIRLLLENSAYIGVTDMFGELPIDDIDPLILESHFDECISSFNETWDENFEIHFDYSNFGPLVTSITGSSLEMLPVIKMARNPELKKLLNHPLLASFLFLKWKCLSKHIHIWFFLRSLYLISFICYNVGFYNQNRDSWFLWILIPICGCGLLINLVFRLWQLYGATIRFVSKNPIEINDSPKLNIFKFLCFVFINGFLVCSIINYDFGGEKNRRGIAGIFILVLGFDLANVIGSLPYFSMSEYMIMFKTISKNLFSALCHYLIIYVVFAFALHTLNFTDFNKPRKTSSSVDPANSENDPEDLINLFVFLPMTIFKAMITGEFHGGSFLFDSFGHYTVFFLFIIFVCVVLANLLTGLAIGDTQEVKQNAELISLIQKAELLWEFERYLDILEQWLMKSTQPTENRNDENRPLLARPLKFLINCKRTDNNVLGYLPKSKIGFLPNKNNEISIPGLEMSARNGNFLAKYVQYMDSKVAKQARVKKTKNK